MTEQQKIIIVGAGHNGLTCAAYLARHGKEVLVLEAAGHAGGMAATCEIADGYRMSDVAQFVYQMQPQIVKDLELERFGLKFAATDLATVTLSEDGEHVRMRGANLNGNVSERDKNSMHVFHQLMKKYAQLVQRYNNKTPPLLANGKHADKMTLAKLGWDIRRLGRDDMRDFLRIIGINMYDLLNEFFDSKQVKGALALNAVLGTHLGARSPNSVLTYLHRLSGSSAGKSAAVALPQDGMGGVAQAFVKAAQAAGAKVRTGAVVKRIVVDGDHVSGVELENGEVIGASRVISNADPKTTVMQLVGARHFETGFVRRINNIRMRGNAARLHLALSGVPEFTGLDSDELSQRLLVAPDMDYVERAFNPAKYGQWSVDPVMEISVPSLADTSLAPAGGHVLSATVQYAPYHLKGGWTESATTQFRELVIETLARYAPGIRAQIVHAELLSPAALEKRYRVYGGHWHHGEMALDQFLFVRPVVGAPQYALPLNGLYLCGAGAHPGGGISGAAGRNAAMAIVSEDKSA